jgi:LDH2 family malate/lactate/ureidoglycolate dehydrogenase
MDRRWRADDLALFTRRSFGVLDVPPEDAALVAESLVNADLIGVATHGVARLPSYVERLERGLVKARPAISVEGGLPWSARIDADNAMGAVAGERAVRAVQARVASFGIGAAVVRGSNHFGTAGHYARALAGSDCIGICLSPGSKSLAPFGTREPLLGTNPWSVSVPAGRFANWTMDMATSVAARGHIRIAAKTGKAIPEGWALDREGRATTDAAAALRGVMLPFAGPKGSAIAMLVEIMGGVLSGAAFGGEVRDMNVDFEAPQDVGHFFMAMRIEGFMPLDRFNRRMETLIERLRALKPAAGVRAVMYPGEPEALALERNKAAGVPLPAEIAESLRTMGGRLDVPFPEPVA